MRRNDREMPASFALGVTDKCEYAVLSTVDSEGLPYAVPISIVRDGENIYFHSATDGTKNDILCNTEMVCLVCVGDTHRMQDKFTTEYESAIIMGIPSEVTDINEKIKVLRMLCERHTPENMQNFDATVKRSINRTAVWCIKILSITGKCKKCDKNRTN